MFGTAKLIMVGIMVTGLAGGVAYTYKLKADNEMLKANAIKMESAIDEQKTLIENQKKDFAQILETNKQMNALINNLKKDIEALDKRFNKKDRDIGKLAIEKSKVIERIINKASDKAARCMEIASGSPLTKEEMNATKKSEINTECPSLANPNYIPY
jgi:septal ring factor EnvC (AmiA/AmiB activator)